MSDPFAEGFEIIIPPQGDEEEWDPDVSTPQPEYLEKVYGIVADLGVSKEEVNYEETGIGVGAEAAAITLILSGLGALFFAGKKINENLDAWIEISKKVRSVLSRLNASYVSQPVALALGIEAIIKANPKASRIDLQGDFIHVVPNSSMDMTGLATKDGRPIQEVFRSQPMRYYTFVFRVLDEGQQTEGYWAHVPGTVHVICIASTGRIEFHHILAVRNWHKLHGIED